MKKEFLILLCCAFTTLFTACDERNEPVNETPKTLHVATAGNLSTLIAETEKYEVTNLTLTGNLNGSDIRCIREMAGGETKKGKLSVLDLSGANIVEGGAPYYIERNSINGINADLDFFTENNCISSNMFRLCENLTTVTLPDNITSIGEWAFGACIRLTTINIPDAITTIENNTFNCCVALKSITIPDNVASIGISAFISCSDLTSVKLGEKVAFIGIRAFESCSKLTSITLPKSVTEIELMAFSYCSGLENIYSENPVPPTCYKSTFQDISNEGDYNSTCTVHVPAGSVQAYKEATGWKQFKNIVEKP